MQQTSALVPSSVHARAQPGGDTLAHDPQGHRQQVYGNTEEIKESIRTMLDNGEVGPVKISAYLT